MIILVDEIRFVASHYFALALLILISYVFGRQLTHRLRYQSFWEQASFSITLGLGVIAYVVLLLGLLGLLYAWALIIVLFAGLAICYPIWINRVREIPILWKRVSASRKGRIVLILAAVMILVALAAPILLLPVYPPTTFDATMYHLPWAKIFAQEHQLVFTPYLRYPVLPQTNQMLFTLALLLYDDVLAQMIELLMMATLLSAVVAFGRRYFSTQAGLWAAALLLGSPLVLWAGSVAYVEMGVTLMVTTTVYAFWNWLQTREQSWLLLSAVLCGLAIGTKAPALFFLATLTLVTLYKGFRKRDFSPTLIFVTVALLVASPWFARSFYYTGNPIFPLFYEQFGRLFGFGHSQGEYYRGLMEAVKTAGISREPAYLLLWHLAVKGFIPPGGPSISRLPLLLLPLSIIVSIRRVRIAGLLVLFVAYTVFWLSTARDLRFLLPAWPIISLVSAAAISHLVSRLPWLGNARRYHALTALGIALVAYPGWEYSEQTKLERGQIPVNREQRDAYLSRQLISYPAHKMLNDLRGGDYTLYAVFDENLAYFTDGLSMGEHFGASHYSLIWDKLANGQALFNQLKGLGADYFLVNNSGVKITLPQDTFFQSHFKPIYESGEVHLFELSDTPFQLGINNILKNPDFEELAKGRLMGWQIAGAPVVDSSAQNSYSGLVAVRCNRAADVLYQVVPVNSGVRYSLSCRARSVESIGTAKLQINWLDVKGALVHQDFRAIDLGSKWVSYEVSVQSPENAVSATIYVSPLDPSSVWFDDVSFGEIAYRSLR